jgi:hypothetical protein
MASKEITGVIVSDKMDKSVVSRRAPGADALYGKTQRGRPGSWRTTRRTMPRSATAWRLSSRGRSAGASAGSSPVWSRKRRGSSHDPDAIDS